MFLQKPLTTHGSLHCKGSKLVQVPFNALNSPNKMSSTNVVQNKQEEANILVENQTEEFSKGYQLIAQRINELTSQIEKLDNVIQEQGFQIGLLTEENRQLKHNYQPEEQMLTENRLLKQNLEILDQEKQNIQTFYEEQVQELNNQLSNIHKEHSLLNEEHCKGIEDKIKQFEEIIQDLVCENRRLLNETQQKDQDIQFYITKLEGTERILKKGHLNKDLYGLEQENRLLQTQITNLQESFKCQVDKLEAKIQIIIEENDRLVKNKTNLSSEKQQKSAQKQVPPKQKVKKILSNCINVT